MKQFIGFARIDHINEFHGITPTEMYTTQKPRLKERPREGKVTINVAPIPMLAEQRQRSVNGRSTDLRLGEIGNVQTDGLLDMRPNEMVFAVKDDLRTSVVWQNPLGDQRVPGFTSFNGYPLDRNEDQDSFEAKFVSLGWCHGEYSAGNPLAPPNGVAVQAAGILAVVLNSDKPVTAGDLIRWRLRKVDKDEREKDNRRLETAIAGSPGMLPHKYIAVLEPYYPGTMNIQQRAFDWLIGMLKKAETDKKEPEFMPYKCAPSDARLSPIQAYAIFGLWKDALAKMLLPDVAQHPTAAFDPKWFIEMGLQAPDGTHQFDCAQTIAFLNAWYPSLAGKPSHLPECLSHYFEDSILSLELCLREERSHVCGKAMQSARQGEPFDMLILP